MPIHDHDPSPVNPLPPVVVALALVIFGVELVFWAGEQGLVGGAGAVGWRLEALGAYAFAAPLVPYLLQTGGLPLEYLIRFLSYVFVQGSFSQAIWVCVLLLALGKFVGEVFRAWAVVTVFFGSAIGGAFIFGLVPGNDYPLVGGFPAVYGLIGAYTWIMWTIAGNAGSNRAQAFSMIAFLMGIQLVFGMFFGGGPDWVADLGGFVTGFGLSFLVGPGGFARLLARFRR